MPNILTENDLLILKNSINNPSLFTEYYFGVKLLPYQVETLMAKQANILTLGGRGSGKTYGWAVGYLWLMCMMPDTRILWTSYTSDQAAISFYEVMYPLISRNEQCHVLLPNGLNGSIVRKPYPRITMAIPGTNLPPSQIECKPIDATGSGNTKRGFSYGIIHIDEGGLIYDGSTINTLRASLRGNRWNGDPILGRMSVSTTPTSAQWLRDWWESANNPMYPGYDPDEYKAIRVRSTDNVTLDPDQVRRFWMGMSPEERQVEIEADFPESTGNEFSPRVVNACQDESLNHQLDEMIENEIPGADKVISGRLGITRYQMPAIPGHRYILAGDPGTGDPPYRNAPCIQVWDITHDVYELVFFSWVFGRGDYRNFFNEFEWAYAYYKPDFSVFDATGTQKAMDQLYVEAKGLLVEGMSVTRDKPAMINAAKILMQRGKLKFPFISALRSQLLSYNQEEDRKLAQDIVMTLVMAAWKMRVLTYEDTDPEHVLDEDWEDDIYSEDRFVGRDLEVIGR